MEPRTQQGRAGLAALRAEPASALVARPEDAVPAPGAVEALRRLAPRVRTLALVTGRPADGVVELAGLADVAGLLVLGQYGTQRWDGALSGDPVAPGIEELRRALPAHIGDARLEDKGLSLVVHLRGLPDPVGEQARLQPVLRGLAEPYGLEVHPGRLVLEVRPPGSDKRTALLSLCEPPPSAVLFAGDDVGDLPAFDAVEELRGRGVPGLTVCSSSDEGPPELRERADLVVDGPAGLVRLLEDLLAD